MIDTLCRLMLPELPQTIDPKALARKGATIEGRYTVRDLHRLCEILADHSCLISFRLEFGQDKDKKQCLINGIIEARLITICQRCLDVMELSMSCPVYLGVIGDPAEAAGLPEDCEPLLLESDSISLPTFIEDELILALPISAMHEADKCAATSVLHDINTAARKNPFAVLKGFKQKTRNA